MKIAAKDVIYVGLLSALCAIATVINIPVPGGAMVHTDRQIIEIIMSKHC